MAWLSKSCKILCLQRVFLLLNFVLLLLFILLYYGGPFVSEEVNNHLKRAAEIQPGLRNGLNKTNGEVRNAGDNGFTVDDKPSTGEAVRGQTDDQRRVKQEPLPIIYMITPTVRRTARKADFTRLAQTIRQVPNLHWIVIEDGHELCGSVSNVLRRLIANYTYVVAPTPNDTLLGSDRSMNKGIFQRNAALEWIRSRHKDINGTYPEGVVYFADDDNTYDLRLFEIMRRVERVGVWPVALAGGVKLESPRINTTSGRLVGFEVGFAPNRTYAVDMAGFALGLDLVLSNQSVHFPLVTVRGWNEAALFDTLNITYEDIQVLGLDVRTPDGRLEPLVWHTKTAEVNLYAESEFRMNYGNKTSDEGWEV